MNSQLPSEERCPHGKTGDEHCPECDDSDESPEPDDLCPHGLGCDEICGDCDDEEFGQ